MFGAQTKLIAAVGLGLVLVALAAWGAMERGRADGLLAENAELRQTLRGYTDALASCRNDARERAAADRQAAEAAATAAAASVSRDFDRGVAVGRAICQARAS